MPPSLPFLSPVAVDGHVFTKQNMARPFSLFVLDQPKATVFLQNFVARFVSRTIDHSPNHTPCNDVRLRYASVHNLRQP